MFCDGEEMNFQAEIRALDDLNKAYFEQEYRHTMTNILKRQRAKRMVSARNELEHIKELEQ